jgi:arsenate reductase
MNITIYHNPRCSKSRQTLALLEENGVSPNVVKYLETPLNVEDIRELIEKLGLENPRDLMRKGEAIYKDLGLEDISEASALIQVMADNPKLIERPIVVCGDKAVLGRPPENVNKLL